MATWVGIDFGTSNSGVAIASSGQVRVLPIDPKNTIPEVCKTILYLTRDQNTYIGQEAVEYYYQQNVGRIRSFVKKRVGEVEYRGADMFYVTDVYALVDEMSPGRLLQYLKTALRSEGYQGTRIFDRFYSPAELVSIYLKELKSRAQVILNEDIHGVILGRPVKFAKTTELDKRVEDALRSAALEAGFQQVEFELEPVAAALYYEQSLSHPETALIFDFGGGTLDITVMRLGDPGQQIVFSSGGIDIAGSDFDRAIIRQQMLRHFGHGLLDGHPEVIELIQSVQDWMALPEQSTPINRRRLQQAIHSGIAPVQLKSLESLIFNDLAFSFYRVVEEGKIQLSRQGTAVMQMRDPGMKLWQLYTRGQFEKDIRQYSETIFQVLLETLNSTGFEPGQIDAVVTTGGSSSIPLFQDMLSNLFGRAKIKSSDAFNSVTAGLGLRSSHSRRF